MWAEDDVEAAVAARSSEAGIGALEPRLVLVVDDSPEDRASYRRLLARATDWAVIEAESGSEGLTSAASHRPSCVLLDYQLPDLDGMEFLAALRAQPAGGDVAVVMVTGQGNEQVAASVMRRGARDYLVKSEITASRLVDAMRSACAATVLKRERRRHAAMLAERNDETDRLVSSISSFLIGLDEHGRVVRWNAAAESLLGPQVALAIGQPLAACRLPFPLERVEAALVRCTLARPEHLPAMPCRGEAGPHRLVDVTVNRIEHNGRPNGWVLLGQDVTNAVETERALREAQKLEAVGTLAAGIAHEINTPIQFISDNLRFLADAMPTLFTLITIGDRIAAAARAGELGGVPLDEFDAVRRQGDVDELKVEMPAAVTQALEGAERVATIVRAMKRISHPGGQGKDLVDVNGAIGDTIVISRTEWKDVAEIETDLDPALPPVACVPGELPQVLLNLIVNAAHAIADVPRDPPGAKGRISIITRRTESGVEIAVRDTGVGVAADIAERIFEPFFTTKPVGRGTGQGLSLARGIVVERHGGTLTFESRAGEGTTFFIRLPIGVAAASGKEDAP
jgi:PAS domain S-box-containing protein